MVSRVTRVSMMLRRCGVEGAGHVRIHRRTWLTWLPASSRLLRSLLPWGSHLLPTCLPTEYMYSYRSQVCKVCRDFTADGTRRGGRFAGLAKIPHRGSACGFSNLSESMMNVDVNMHMHNGHALSPIPYRNSARRQSGSRMATANNCDHCPVPGKLHSRKLHSLAFSASTLRPKR